MKKLSIIRFKPNPEHYDAFVKSLKHFILLPDRKGIVDSFIMTKDKESFSIVVRYADQLKSASKQGVKYLNTVSNMLQEYDEIDRHTTSL